jgi:hypothetical protein
MKRLGVFVNPCSAQQNMFIANGAEWETWGERHRKPRGRSKSGWACHQPSTSKDRMQERIENLLQQG